MKLKPPGLAEVLEEIDFFVRERTVASLSNR